MRRFMLVVAICLLVPCAVMAEWVPPAEPDPHAILNEARADAEAGRHEVALAKHVWFHEHALEHGPELYGVRLSFALSDWHRLGEVYPPALEKLTEVRDEAAKHVAEGKAEAERLFHLFHDMHAINRQLAEEERTVEMFALVDKEQPEIARRVYGIAQPALVQAREFELCGKYLEPEQSADRMIEFYRMNRERAEEGDSPVPGDYLLGYAEATFTREAATLVALLVLNERKAEAERIAERVKGEAENAEREAAIDAALEGKLPSGRGE